jgi:hypothetical protein
VLQLAYACVSYQNTQYTSISLQRNNHDQADATQQGRNDLVWFFHACILSLFRRRRFAGTSSSRSHLCVHQKAPAQDRCSARWPLQAFYNSRPHGVVPNPSGLGVRSVAQTAHDCQHDPLLVDRWGPHNSSQQSTASLMEEHQCRGNSY